MSQKTNRHKAREHAFKILYELSFQPEKEVSEAIDLYLEGLEGEEEISERDLAFIRRETEGAWKALGELDPKIAATLHGWKLERLSKVDLAILRLALYEIIYADDIPVNVSINEAVELAKAYSQESGKSFVNGVLSNFTGKAQADAPAEEAADDEPAEDTAAEKAAEAPVAEPAAEESADA